nr:hypothetical protein [Pseudonocardia sp. AL041005-10]
MSGASPLPEWLRDAPPWVQAIGLVVGAAMVIAPVLGVIYARKAGSTTPAATGSSEGPAGSTTTSSAPAARVDQTVQILDRMVTNLQISHDELEQEAAGMRTALAEAERREARLTAQLEVSQELLNQARAELTQARQEITELRRERAAFRNARTQPLPPTPGLSL